MSKTLLWVLAAHDGIPLMVATQRISAGSALPQSAEYLARKIDEDEFSPITHRQARRYRRQAGGPGISDMPFLCLEDLNREVRSLRKLRSIRF